MTGKTGIRTGASLVLRDVSWRPRGGDQPILHATSLSLAPGRVLGIVGPNGAGKTTLLRLLYRYYRPATGTVSVDGMDIWRCSARQAAQTVAAVLQEQPTDFALTVREIVALGRTPYRSGFGSAAVIDGALDTLGLTALAHRRLGTLSGGERQRVIVARALAQEPSLLILDEPTNHLDIRHQLEVLALIRALPLTIVTSLHDLNMAAGVCDDILLLKAGHPLGFGPPEDVLSEATVSEAFHVEARREHLSPSDTRHLTFHLKEKEGQP